MDMVVLVALALLAWLAGWAMGVRAYFRANEAMRRIEQLTAEIARLRGPIPEPPEAETWPDEFDEPEPLPEEPDETATTPAADPVLAAATTAPPPGESLEERLALRWGVWLGAAALLLAGVFLIRYAIEEALLGPAPRTALAALLGVALVLASEWLGRRPPRGGLPDHAPAALAAGGVAVLFGAAYAAASLYALLPPLVGFAAMAGAAAAGLLLSLRRGPLVAAVGLVGAFLTPLLLEVETPEPWGLAAYLLAVTAAAMAVVRITAWGWLGWSASLLAAPYVLGLSHGTQPWAMALFVPLATALHLALLPGRALDHPLGRQLAHLPLIVLGLALLPAVLNSPGLAAPVGLLLLSPIALARSAAEPRLPWLPPLAATLGLATLWCWAVAPWTDPETLRLDGTVLTWLPGPVVPEALQPLLLVALALALTHGLAGLLLERRSGLRFSALAAAVPPLALLIVYARVAGFATEPAWAAVAALLAALLTGAAARAIPRFPLSAGAHAAGATAALALMTAMLLRQHWLSLAVALLLPPLAYIAGRTGLAALRWVALAVAGVVLVRLLLNPAVLGYDFGVTPVLNGLWLAYGAPALALWLAARRFRRDGHADAPVALLEAGAIALLTALALLLIRHIVQAGDLADESWNFIEAALQQAAVTVLAALLVLAGRRGGSPIPRLAGQVLGGVALCAGTALLVLNPWLLGEAVGEWPVLNALLPAYLLPAMLAAWATRWPEAVGARWLLARFSLVLLLAWVMFSVRQAFAGSWLSNGDVGAGELYAYSGACIMLGAGVLALGIRSGTGWLRQAAMALIALATLKVFIVDMGTLVGLWRVLSFLGLGLALIALGAVYRRFVVRP